MHFMAAHSVMRSRKKAQDRDALMSSLREMKERQNPLIRMQGKQDKKKDECTDKRHYKGVKGPSILINLLYFYLIWGFVVDYIYAILLGMTKCHMEYLFDSTKKKCWIDMTNNIASKNLTDTIDNHLLSI